LEEAARELLRVNEEWRGFCRTPKLPAVPWAFAFSELTELRELNERRELEKAKPPLEVQVTEKDILFKEINHRVKNSLQIAAPRR
jgi:two-component sensor histidine kinase